MDSPVTMIFLLFLVASLAMWARMVHRHRGHGHWLPYDPRRITPWGLVDLLVIVLASGMLQVAAIRYLFYRGLIDSTETLSALPPLQQGLVLVAGSLGQLAATALFVIFTFLIRPATTASDLGWSGRHLWTDIKLGLLAFLLFVPPVLLVQSVLVQFVASKHPLIEMLRADPNPFFMMLAGFSAVLIAPLVEEMLFRVVFQGWLERAVLFVDEPLSLLLGGRLVGKVVPFDPLDPGHGFDERPPAKREEAAGKQGNQPSDVAAQPSCKDPGRFWFIPILLSAGMFALMHWSHGPDWVPLFLLALGLGYVYQRTHRVLPCIIVHLLLNTCTLMALAYELSASNSQ